MWQLCVEEVYLTRWCLGPACVLEVPEPLSSVLSFQPRTRDSSPSSILADCNWPMTVLHSDLGSVKLLDRSYEDTRRQ